MIENEDLCNDIRSLGGPITGYWIEKREQNTDKWIPVNVSPCQSTHYTVPSLIEDRIYEFRVIAENEAGRGNPSDASKPTRVRLWIRLVPFTLHILSITRSKIRMRPLHQNS